MELLRMGIVYLHLIACCVAIGMVLTSDIAMVRQLFDTDLAQHDQSHLSHIQRTVSLALIGLWLTGIMIISLDLSLKGWSYLENPKLQAKVLIVILLTFNGVILHKAVLPAMQKAGSLLKLQLNQRLMVLFSGVISGVSWFYAALLGIGRPLNWKYSLLEILIAYPLLILGGYVTMLILTALAQHKHNMQLPPSRREHV